MFRPDAATADRRVAHRSARDRASWWARICPISSAARKWLRTISTPSIDTRRNSPAVLTSHRDIDSVAR